ncbi:MAG TPA: adenylate/guanylate cyclase domain-containing protein, partial [Acidimicrobiia bacterium]|nr:adenylate/guanylate cyclase domain-containing protein [Acidimicrobiia bacterium]
MFCDLVASTERRARLGDDAFDVFAARFLAVLRGEISQAQGRELSNAGDGLMVVFAVSAADAVACATAMHRAVAALDPVDAPQLRIGISSGEVAQVGDEFSGMPIVEAARLQSAAAPGQTLANAVVRALLGTRRAFRFRDVGALRLKGLPAPLAAVEVVDDEMAAESAPKVAYQAMSSSTSGGLAPDYPAGVSRSSTTGEHRERMTVENMAVLVTDAVDWTALASRLAPEVADELRRGHFSALRQAIAQSGGTEVKNLGGGLMVVFATASAALSCAVAMQQAIERDNRASEHAVGLRVGLSAGEVSREEGDYFGDPVIEAVRLCARSEIGQILAADVLRVVAGRRIRHECRALGELALKGLPDPVATVEVLWEPLGAADTGAAIPMPARLTARPTVGVVGRDAELESMLTAFKRVAEGEGREVVLVSGEAGLGKTTLVAEA